MQFLKDRKEIEKQNFSMDDNFEVEIGPDAEAVVNRHENRKKSNEFIFKPQDAVNNFTMF